jgi:carbonic anhydrase
MKTLSKEAQEKISPKQAIAILKEGNRRFVNNLKLNRNLLQQLTETRKSQHPFAVIISCMDSRAPAELIFDQGLGDIFSVRIAGNIINDDILGSTEFGCAVVGAKAVVVLGHTGCGAIKGALDQVQLGNLNSVLTKIQYSIPHEDSHFKKLSSEEKIDHLTKSNVEHSLSEIRNRSAILRDLEAGGEIVLIGGIYDLNNGNVVFFKAENLESLDSEIL